MRLTETVEKCPNCNSYFDNRISGRAVLHAFLTGKESIYVYCSEKCLIRKLENINSGVPEIFRIRIKNQTRIPAGSGNPVVYRVDFEQEILRVK